MFVFGFLFALLIPLLSMVALATALASGDAGVASLMAALFGYGVLTDWHVRRRQERGAIPVPVQDAPRRRTSRGPAQGRIDVAFTGRLQWSLPSRGRSQDSLSPPLLQGGMSLRARATTGYGDGTRALRGTSNSAGLIEGATGTAARVLVMTSDGPYQELLGRVLEAGGYTMLPCPAGEDAFDAVSREQPDLVIVDLDALSSEDGWSVLDLLTLDPETSHIPIVAMTMQIESIERAEEWLGDHNIVTLPKPFNPADLRLAVSAALQSGDAGVSPSHWVRTYRRDL